MIRASQKTRLALGRSIVCAVVCFVAGGLTGCGPGESIKPSSGEVRGTPIVTSSKMANSPAASPASTGTNDSDSGKAVPSVTAAAATATKPADDLAMDKAKPTPLGFDLLSAYTFEVSDELMGPVTNNVAVVAQKTSAQIPQNVKTYDQKKVALRGFMLPLKVEGGLVTEMLIMKDQSMCCYGTTPRINDWVSVRMKGKGVRPMMDMPVTLFGTMRIGETRENGYLVGIYSLDGEGMENSEKK